MRLLPEDPAEYLRRLGEAREGPHDIAGAALMFAALDHFGRDLDPYIVHLAEIAEQARRESRMAVNAEDGARALASLLAGHHGYDGDRLAYDACLALADAGAPLHNEAALRLQGLKRRLN